MKNQVVVQRSQHIMIIYIPGSVFAKIIAQSLSASIHSGQRKAVLRCVAVSMHIPVLSYKHLLATLLNFEHSSILYFINSSSCARVTISYYINIMIFHFKLIFRRISHTAQLILACTDQVARSYFQFLAGRAAVVTTTSYHYHLPLRLRAILYQLWLLAWLQ